MTTAAGPAVDVSRTIDQGRWSGYQQWLVFLTALTIIFDGIDNQLLGVTIPSIMAEWHVARSAFAPRVGHVFRPDFSIASASASIDWRVWGCWVTSFFWAGAGPGVGRAIPPPPATHSSAA